MAAFVHPKAICESQRIGDGTRIWAFAHVLPGATLGADCNVCDGVFIENDVVVGDRVTIKCGVQLWDGIRVEDDVFIGPNATFTNDKFPRSRVWPARFESTVVHRGASIGANATLLPGITIGAGAMIGAGAVVTRDVPPFGIVMGNPAKLVGYTNTVPSASAVTHHELEGIPGSMALTSVVDMRGSLVAGEIDKHIPFSPRRFFVVHDVPSREIRGEHAHRECEQYMVCVAGSVRAVVDDGTRRVEHVLDRPGRGLYMPPLTWGTQYDYSPDAILLVLASHEYDAEDYIRDYDEFLAAVGEPEAGGARDGLRPEPTESDSVEGPQTREP